MLPNKYNINIGVYGQVVGVGGADDTALAFSYPTPTTAVPSQSWVKSLFDPRDARNFTPKGEDAFAFWANSDGNFYAIIFRSADARNGRLMLVINVKGGMSNSGAEALRTLRSLKKSYIECSDGKLFNDEIDARLASFRNSLISYNNYAPLAKVPQNKGYRVFTDEDQLAEMFTFPHQSESATYKCVYFVPNEITQFDPNFVKITTPVIVSYHIEKQPIDVSINPSRSVFSKGEILSITYKKNGCEPETKKIRIDGINNNFITYSGYTIQIKDATSAGIRFYRKVDITFVKEGFNTSISSVYITSTNRNVIIKSSSISVPEGYTNIELSVSKNGYQITKYTLTKQDLEAKKATIPMKPTQGGRSNTGGGNGHTQPHPTSFLTTLLKFALVAFVLALAGVVALMVLGIWPQESESTTSQKTITTVIDKNATADSTRIKNREADLAYLKKNDKWDKSKLKSEDFKVLIDYIINKQVKDAFNHHYSQEDKINGYWEQCCKIYNDIKKEVDKEELEGAFKRASKNNRIINVKQLFIELNEFWRQQQKTEKAEINAVSPAKAASKAESSRSTPNKSRSSTNVDHNSQPVNSNSNPVQKRLTSH